MLAEKIFNDIHKFARIEPPKGEVDCGFQNGFAICGDIRDEEKRGCADAQLPNTNPQ